MGELIRLDKFLVEMGIGTRSQIKDGAKRGKLLVNNDVEKKADRKINPDCDKVFWEGREIVYLAVEYYMLNKPQGVVSATKDNLYPTVLDLIQDKQRNDLFPVGRLDLDTEGLLLITNDGDLAHRLLSPKHHVDKVYQAIVEGILPIDCIAQFNDGIILSDGTLTRPAKLEVLTTDANTTTVRLTIREGKFHQVKRMFEAVGGNVIYLKRIQMGSLLLDPLLKLGEYRLLNDNEINQIKGKQHVKR